MRVGYNQDLHGPASAAARIDFLVKVSVFLLSVLVGGAKTVPTQAFTVVKSIS
jgi:hypothetical protein